MDHIDRNIYKYLDFSKALIICVSTGKDSVALLNKLLPYKEKFVEGFEILHFNHGLRKASKKEEKYLASFCAERSVAFKKIDLPVKDYSQKYSLSMEESARILRYKNLSVYTAEQDKKGIIFTAHTASDQLETILFRLAKGSSRSGFQAVRKEITLSSGWIVRRPMLEITSEEILEYLKTAGIKYFEDKSNKDITIPRNFIRHNIIRHLKRINPSVEKNISRQIDIWSAEEKYLDAVVIQSLKDMKINAKKTEIYVELKDLLSYNIWLKRRILKTISPVDLDYNRIESILGLLEKTGALNTIDLGSGWYVRKEYHQLIFEKKSPEQNFFIYDLKPDQETFIKETGSKVKVSIVKGPLAPDPDPRIEIFDADKIDLDKLQVRSRRKGDRMVPFGMTGFKKLKDLCIDLKLTLRSRVSLLVFENAERVIWAAPYRRAEFAPVTEDTKKVLKLEID